MIRNTGTCAHCDKPFETADGDTHRGPIRGRLVHSNPFVCLRVLEERAETAEAKLAALSPSQPNEAIAAQLAALVTELHDVYEEIGGHTFAYWLRHGDGESFLADALADFTRTNIPPSGPPPGNLTPMTRPSCRATRSLAQLGRLGDVMRISRREFIRLAGLSTGVGLSVGPSRLASAMINVQAARESEAVRREVYGALPAGVADGRPNVLWIMTDDQEWQSWALPYTRLDGRGQVVTDGDGEPVRDYAMSYLRGMPGGGWTDFTQNTCAAAICAPSRAALLTGVPAREHGVLRNGLIDNLDESSTLAVWLSEAGYETHLRGKYSFGDGKRGRPTPPGWTTFNGNGGRAKPVFDAGEQLVREAARCGKPWLICLWPTDPHRLAKPTKANAAINLQPPPLPDNINEADVSDKPTWVRTLPLMPTGKVKAAQKERVRGYQALMGVDQGAQQVIEALVETGQFDNTIIIFTADNGDSFGAHRLLFKDMIYDEASRVPLAIRLPWLTENRVENRVVSHLDVTATIVAATGITPDRPLLGHSLLPLMEEDAAPWEGVAFVESHGSPGPRAKGRPSFKGLRTGGDGWGYYAYAEHPTGEVELYDMAVDPAQLDNVAGRPEYATVREALAARLDEFLSRPGYEG